MLKTVAMSDSRNNYLFAYVNNIKVFFKTHLGKRKTVIWIHVLEILHVNDNISDKQETFFHR